MVWNFLMVLSALIFSVTLFEAPLLSSMVGELMGKSIFSFCWFDCCSLYPIYSFFFNFDA